MAMVVVDNSSLQANSQPKSGGLVWGSAATWRCSTSITWTEWTLTMTLWSWWQHYKYRRGYYYYHYLYRHESVVCLLHSWEHVGAVQMSTSIGELNSEMDFRVFFGTVHRFYTDVSWSVYHAEGSSGFPCLLESPGFFSWKFQDLESPGKSLWSWKVLEIKA